MGRRTENKIVLIRRRTRLDDLIARFNTEDQARFHVERLGADFADYRAEDLTYKQAVREAESILSDHGRVQVIDRAFLPNFIFGRQDTVVAIGQDGLVANALKYLDGQPLIGVNPDPARWEGVLLPFGVRDLDRTLPEVLARRRPVRWVTMAQARLNTGETLRAVNDLFIGSRTHVSARYSIRIGDRAENHSSSGIVVSTGLGSTGWFRSIVAGALGVASAMTGRGVKSQLQSPARAPMPWDADWLYFSVREPWPSTTSGAEIVFGRIAPREPLRLVSQMPDNGVIFSDGIESDFIRFDSGTEATIGLAETRGCLVV